MSHPLNEYIDMQTVTISESSFSLLVELAQAQGIDPQQLLTALVQTSFDALEQPDTPPPLFLTSD